MADGLTPKQQRFVLEYLIDLNATAAAIRAGYSAKTAGAIGHENLTKPEIVAAIELEREKHACKLEITAERVLKELARIGFSDPRKLYKADGSLKPIIELDDDTAATVASVEVFEEFAGRGDEREQIGWTKKLRHWDKVAALEKLGKHLNLFVDQHSFLGADGKPFDISQIPDDRLAIIHKALVSSTGSGPANGSGNGTAPPTNGVLPH